MSYHRDGVKLECLASNRSNFQVGEGSCAQENMLMQCRSMQHANNDNSVMASYASITEYCDETVSLAMEEGERG